MFTIKQRSFISKSNEEWKYILKALLTCIHTVHLTMVCIGYTLIEISIIISEINMKIYRTFFVSSLQIDNFKIEISNIWVIYYVCKLVIAYLVDA